MGRNGSSYRAQTFANVNVLTAVLGYGAFGASDRRDVTSKWMELRDG